MRINVEEIGDEGLDVHDSLSRAWIDSAIGSDLFSAAADADLSAHLEKVEESVLLRAELRPRLKTACRRCLEPVEVTLPLSFSLSLVPRKVQPRRLQPDDDRSSPAEPEGGPRGSFDPRDADQETFEGHSLELEPLVREQILLALPMDALCREGCKGLCATCGHNLNESPCGCKAETRDPRWEKLRKLKLH